MVLVNKFGQTTTSRICSFRMAASSPAARPAIRRSPSWRLLPGRRITSPALCSERKSSTAPERLPRIRNAASGKASSIPVSEAVDV